VHRVENGERFSKVYDERCIEEQRVNNGSRCIEEKRINDG
jgi:hypothetical protein